MLGCVGITCDETEALNAAADHKRKQGLFTCDGSILT